MNHKYFGIFAATHNSSIALIQSENNELDIEVAPAERLNRTKHTGGFPFASLKYFLNSFSKSSNKNQTITGNCYYKKMKDFEKISVSSGMSDIIKNFNAEFFLANKNPEYRDVSHHLCHFYSCLAQYPFEESIVLVMDGVGSAYKDYDGIEAKENKFPSKDKELSRESVSVYHQTGDSFECIYKEWEHTYSWKIKDREFATGNSLGNIYAAAAYVMFGDWKYSGKLMGLSVHGTPDNDSLNKYSEPNDFLHEYILKHEFDWLDKNGFDGLEENDFLLRANFAATVQKYYENQLLRIIEKLESLKVNTNNLSLAGGCALNCLGNDFFYQNSRFKNIYVPAYPDDTGICIGSSFSGLYEKEANIPKTPIGKIKGSLGAKKNNLDFNYHLKNITDFKVQSISDYNSWIDSLAADIMNDEIIALAYERSEVGPRALGNRSILVSPFINGIAKKLNDQIKFRERFRPYGVFVLQNEVSKYFCVGEDYHSPFMSFAPKVRETYLEQFKEVVCANNTIRIQTITESQKHIYDLLNSLKEKGFGPILINTSLNIMGEPICESEEDFVNFLKNTNVNIGYLGSYKLLKDSN